jgi:predicted transcriptional regulator
MEKTPVSLRLPSDLIGKLDDEAKSKRRTRTLLFVEMLEARYPETINGHQTTAKKTRKKANA